MTFRNIVKMLIISMIYVSGAAYSQTHEKVAYVNINSDYDNTYVSYCSWSSWQNVTYGKQKKLHCNGGHVATAFKNLAHGGCSLSIFNSSYGGSNSNPCAKEVWLGQAPQLRFYDVYLRSGSGGLTYTEARDIFDDAEDALVTIDGAGDTTCNVKFYVKGGAIKNSSGSGSIDSYSDYIALPNGITVVPEILWCDGLRPNIIGCGDTPGARIAVVRLSSAEGLLWAHEIGHNMGLDHRNGPNNLMNSGLDQNKNFVNTAECIAFR